MRVGRLIGPHSEPRPTRPWPVPAAWRHLARFVSPWGEPWCRFCCEASTKDVPAGTVAFSRVARSMHALTGAAHRTAWGRAVGHTDGIHTARSRSMGNMTDKIKKGIKDTAGAVKRGAAKAKDAAVRGVDKSKDTAARA